MIWPLPTQVKQVVLLLLQMLVQVQMGGVSTTKLGRWRRLWMLVQVRMGSVDDTVESVASTLVPPTLSGDGMSVDLSLADSFQVASALIAGGSGGEHPHQSPQIPVSEVQLMVEFLIITSSGCFPRIGR